MPNKSKRDMFAMGYTREDIAAAKVVQDKQRQLNQPVDRIAHILGAQQKRSPAKPVDLTERALRKTGGYEQAARLLDVQALSESSEVRAKTARKASKLAKSLSKSPQLEFDFFGQGNVSFSRQYHDEIVQRLLNANLSQAQFNRAVTVLWTIIRFLAWQSHECTKTAAELAKVLEIQPSNIATTLKLLEGVGAIRRIKLGRGNLIVISPEAAYRGDINKHAQIVERYLAEVGIVK